MANYADKATDEMLAKMENKIARIYADASDGLRESWQNYIKGWDEMVGDKKVHHKGLDERYAEEYKAFQNGKYTQEQFDAWYLAQVGRGDRWKQLKEDTAKKITQANQIAVAYVNDKTPGIYSLNANYTAYEIEKGYGVAFNLVNEQTVKNLMQDKNHTEFRVLSVNPKRDYAWNTQKIQDALVSGILQGDSIKKLTERYLDVMQNNKAAAIRNARTAVTSAQNGGRQSTFDRAEAMGIDLEKEWMATNDERTRDSHRELDGVRVKNGRKFPNGCEYPGDPDGAPNEVYNCRCTMRAVIPKYNGNKRMTALNGGANTQASYAKWVFDKERKKEYTALFTSKSNRANMKEIQELYKHYLNGINTGYLTPLADFELYRNVNKEINDKVIGITTSNGITIKARTFHSIERVIGSVEQKRSGVTVDGVVEALTNKDAIISEVKTKGKGLGQKFTYNGVSVSVNPITGTFVQANPKG